MLLRLLSNLALLLLVSCSSMTQTPQGVPPFPTPPAQSLMPIPALELIGTAPSSEKITGTTTPLLSASKPASPDSSLSAKTGTKSGGLKLSAEQMKLNLQKYLQAHQQKKETKP